MADEADTADSWIQATTDDAVERARRGQGGPFEGFKPSGRCHWCGDAVPPGRVHCLPRDNACAEDHAKHIRFRSQDLWDRSKHTRI